MFSVSDGEILEYVRRLFDDLGYPDRTARNVLRKREVERVFDAVSLRREMASGRIDKHGRFDEAAASWDVSEPWVSRMACELREKEEATGKLKVAPPRRFRVIITHDVDRVTPAEPISLLKAGLSCAGVRRGSWLPFSSAVKSRQFLRNLERMLDLELQHGVRPWFFMLAGSYGLGRGSNRYSIRWNLTRETIRLIQEAKGEIGLHGSYYARERDSYAREAALLADIVGRPVRSHRNHYLRFDPGRIWSQLDRAGIEVDFSLCLSTRMGYRVPLTGPFRPFDWEAGRASNVWAVPTIAMDKWWWPSQSEEVLVQLERLLRNGKDVGGTVAILVHPEMFSIDPRWFELFSRLLDLIEKHGTLCREDTEGFVRGWEEPWRD